MAIKRGFASKIENVEYFYAAEANAAKASVLGLGAGELDAAGERRDYLQYLSQGDNDASAGSFVVLERVGGPAALSPAAPSPFSSLATGQKALGSICRDLVAGVDPATGAVALEGRNYRGVRRNPGGFDIQMGVVKSVSLAAVFDVKRRAGIRAAERKGYDDAIRWAFDTGLMATRVTRDEKTFYEPARKVALAVYAHSTSRAEDPHDHYHGALFAMCERQDGRLGTLSNFLLMRYGGAIHAFKRCSEAGALKRLGLAVERDPDNRRSYRVAGVDQRLVELFSKRREMIEEVARQAGINTADERVAAQLIAYDTRDDKRITDAEALEARWEKELRAAGYSRESFVFSIERAARQQAQMHPVETADQRLTRLRGLVLEALSELQREMAVFTRARLYQTAFEALQVDVDDGAEAARLVAGLEKSGELIMLADWGGEPVYTTQAMIEAETALLKTAWLGRGKGPKIDPASVEAVLERVNANLRTKYGPGAGIKPEQEKAVRHALSGDQFAITQGYAGTGKSFITALQREIVEAQGFRVFGTAPSWKATDVLRTDSGLKRENCVVLAKLLHDYRKGEILFDAKSFIILDEGGMVSTVDMAEIVDIARRTGASLRIQGDAGQFRAVDAGQPFAALQRLLGAAELRDIQRQKTEWQRAASVTLDDANNSGDDATAAIKIRQALQVYDDKGRIVWADDAEAAMAVAIDRVIAWRAAHPGDSTAVITEWNSHARAASVILRDKLKALGQIEAEDTILTVIGRGSKDNTKSTKIAFARGDEVIFGENVAVAGRTIRNNDLARIVLLDTTDSANPRLQFRFEDGQEVEATYAQLVGRRAEGELAVPRMQHAYVVTGHSSQGATYARTVDLTLEGHGREAALVATTRHRIDHLKVVAVDRLIDKLESKKATTLALAKDGRLTRAPEDDDDASDRAQLADIKKAFFAESAGHELLGNVSDFYPDIHMFAGVEKPRPARSKGLPVPMPKPLLAARMQAIAAKLSRSNLATISERGFAPLTHAPDARRRLLGWWEGLKCAGDMANSWLNKTRGISSDVIAKFSANIRAERSRANATNPSEAAFALRDAELRLTGIVRRGPNGFRRLVGTGRRGLFQAGQLASPLKVYLARTTINALSLYQFDNQPDRAALLAMDDGINDEVRGILIRRAKEWPGAIWYVGEDNDFRKNDGPDGEGLAERYPENAIAAIREGDPTAEIVTRNPGADYQDWNDRLRGTNFTKAAVVARYDAEEAARRAEAAASTSGSVRPLRITRGPKYTP